ncbi:MAG: flippase-like domain-containing protein [Erysipelotrichales bacterium]|nr:flippase-like domain-containing protein [Erysipelotrichales bacterium]
MKKYKEKQNRKKSADLASNKKKRIILSCFFIVLAILTIFAVTFGNDSFSFKEFVRFLRDANHIYIVFAFFTVILYILFEGLAIRSIASSLGYKKRVRDSFVYSSADIYFSAITPSASGGQPMTAYFMYKDKIPGSIIAITLLYNLMMYSLAFLVIGIVTFIINPAMYLGLNLISKILIFMGFVVQTVIFIGFYFLLYKDQLLEKLCSFFIGLGVKIHIVKKPDKYLKKIHNVMEEYQEYAITLKEKKGIWFKALIFNILQRAATIGIALFVFLATYGNPSNLFSIWATQVYVAAGSFCVPIPGGMGVADYIMLDGYNNIMEFTRSANLQLLSRSISFYCCIIICGIIVLVKYILARKVKEV